MVLTTTATKSLRGDADDREVVTGLGPLGLHKAVAAECGPDGITANAVLRGDDVTDEEVADAVVFLASDVAGYVTGAPSWSTVRRARPIIETTPGGTRTREPSFNDIAGVGLGDAQDD